MRRRSYWTADSRKTAYSPLKFVSNLPNFEICNLRGLPHRSQNFEPKNDSDFGSDPVKMASLSAVPELCRSLNDFFFRSCGAGAHPIFDNFSSSAGARISCRNNGSLRSNSVKVACFTVAPEPPQIYFFNVNTFLKSVSTSKSRVTYYLDTDWVTYDLDTTTHKIIGVVGSSL